MKETLRHIEVFDTYYRMGAGRTLPALAAQVGVSESTLKRWSTEFEWRLRVEKRDAENAARLLKSTDDDLVATRKKYRKVTQNALAKFVQALQNGDVEVKTVKDFVALVKLDLYLLGDPNASKIDAGGSGNTEVNIVNVNNNWRAFVQEHNISMDDVMKEARRLAGSGGD